MTAATSLKLLLNDRSSSLIKRILRGSTLSLTYHRIFQRARTYSPQLNNLNLFLTEQKDHA